MSIINLLKGWPARENLPRNQLRKAANAVFDQEEVCYDALLYGPDPGFAPLRTSIAKWTNEFYQPVSQDGQALNPAMERITITGGASQSLACLLTAFTDVEYTRRIFMASPTYFFGCSMFEDAGFSGRLQGIVEDEEGPRIDILKERLEECEKQTQTRVPVYKASKEYPKVYKYVMYLICSFANPSSITISVKRREELVRLARQYDILLISDDVYDFLAWDADTGAPCINGLPRLIDIDRKIPGTSLYGNTVSNGSFSKVTGPGLRVGWVEGTKDFAYRVSQVAATKSGGAPSQFASAMINELLKENLLNPFIRHHLIPSYASRRRILLNAIDEYLVPLGVTYREQPKVVGGYFMWIKFPAGLSTTELGELSKKSNVMIAPGDMFAVWKDQSGISPDLDRFVRLCWSWEDPERLKTAIMILSDIVKAKLS